MNTTSDVRFHSFAAPHSPLQERLMAVLVALQPYQWPLFSLFLFLSGLVIGRLLKDSKLETVLHNYQHCTDQEQQIIKTQKSFDHKFGVIRKFIYLLLFMTLLYSAVVAAQTPRAQLNREMFRNNLPLVLGIVVLVVSLWLLSRVKHWRLQKIQNSLREFLDLKDHYLEEFLQLIGTDMKVGIVRNESKRLAEKLETENKRLSEMATEKNILESSLQHIKKSKSLDGQMHVALEEFTSKLFSYDWCDKCYDEEAVRAYALRMVEARKSQAASEEPAKSRKDAKATKEGSAKSPKGDEAEAGPLPPLQDIPRPQDCQKDCLLRYHLFCDQLNQELSEKIRRIKSGSKAA